MTLLEAHRHLAAAVSVFRDQYETDRRASPWAMFECLRAVEEAERAAAKHSPFCMSLPIGTRCDCGADEGQGGG